MEDVLRTVEKEELVKLVKVAQRLSLKGASGEWKEFLNAYVKQGRARPSDPSRQARGRLVAFLKTLRKEDSKILAKALKPNPYLALGLEKDETAEQSLVLRTITHDEYPLDYLFPSNAKGWFITELGKKKSQASRSPKIEMVAIDCEMVICNDGSKALVKVAAVDRDLKVLLDELVKPRLPITDYKTDITGLTADDLKKVTQSVEDIQEKFKKFLSVDTILVGQSLNNDMKVLRIDHARVIDTSLVFNYKYPGARKPPRHRRPSLDNLCKHILGYEVRKDGVAHNCVDDAAAAMKLVLAVVEEGVETSIPLPKEILDAEKSRLMLHGVPRNIPNEELIEAMSRNFTNKFNICPFNRKEGRFHCAHAVFNSPAEADEAFEKIAGDLGEDSTAGLPQKQVFLKTTASTGPRLYFYVRKMVVDDAYPEEKKTTIKRSCPEEKKANRKKQKREDDPERPEKQISEKKRPGRKQRKLKN